MAETFKNKSLVRDIADSLVPAIIYIAVNALIIFLIIIDEAVEPFLMDGIVEFIVRFPLVMIHFIIMVMLATLGYLIMAYRLYHWYMDRDESWIPFLDEIGYLLLMTVLVFGPFIAFYFATQVGLGAVFVALFMLVMGFVAVISFDTLNGYRKRARRRIGTL